MNQWAHGKMVVKVNRICVDPSPRRPYFCLVLGDRTFYTSVASDGKWHERFEFNISYQQHLFATLQLDLFVSNVFLPDRHLGRTQVRLMMMGDYESGLTSWFEISDVRSHHHVNRVGMHPSHRPGLGAVELSLQYCKPVAIVEKVGPLAKSDPFSSYLAKDPDLELTDLQRGLGEMSDRLVQAKGKASLPAVPRSSSTLSETLWSALGWESWRSHVMAPARTLEMCKSVVRLLAPLSQGMEYLTTLDLIVAFLTLEMYYVHHRKRQQSPDGLGVATPDIGREAKRFWKFAMAAYGWKGLSFIGRGKGIFRDVLQQDADLKAALNFLEVYEESDFLSYRFRTYELFQPCYYVLHDKKRQELVVSIRGTMDTADAFTDLMCDYDKWTDAGGLVHRGMRRSAGWIIHQAIIPALSKLREENQELKIRRIYVTGHSLGGACASLVSMILNSDRELVSQRYPEVLDRNYEIHAFTFGCPPAVSLKEAQECKSIVTAFVMECDVVPRLSYGALFDLRQQLMTAATPVPNKLDRLAKLLKAKSTSQLTGDAYETMRDGFELLDSGREQLRASHNEHYPKLYIPGRVYELRRKQTQDVPSRGDSVRDGGVPPSVYQSPTGPSRSPAPPPEQSAPSPSIPRPRAAARREPHPQENIFNNHGLTRAPATCLGGSASAKDDSSTLNAVYAPLSETRRRHCESDKFPTAPHLRNNTEGLASSASMCTQSSSTSRSSQLINQSSSCLKSSTSSSLCMITSLVGSRSSGGREPFPACDGNTLEGDVEGDCTGSRRRPQGPHGTGTSSSFLLQGTGLADIFELFRGSNPSEAGPTAAILPSDGWYLTSAIDNSHFDAILLVDNMFVNHLPSSYDRAIASLAVNFPTPAIRPLLDKHTQRLEVTSDTARDT